MPIASIQILRAVAALLVVFGHAQAIVGAGVWRRGGSFETNSLFPWGAGVDLFFVISGFVMVVSSQPLYGAPGAAREFILRRVIRIAPLYWLCLCYVIFRSTALGRSLPDLQSILASFLFIPWDTDGKGVARPIYELGWTLNHEMFFYLVFAACIWARREAAVVMTGGLLVLLVLLDDAVGFTNVQLASWAQPIVLEFVLGMAVAALYGRGFRIPPWLGAVIAAAAIAVLLFDQMHASQHLVNWVIPNEYERLCYWGLPCAALVAGLVLSNRSGLGDGRMTAFAQRVGDASYSLYLLHPFVIGILAAAWFAVGLGALANAWVCVALGMALSVAAALASYRWFEKPVTNWLRDRTSRQGSRPRQAVA